MNSYRVGNCKNCGACCYILYPDKTRRLCQNYNIYSDKHCKIYSNRPKECRDFPRNPMDIERLRQWCGFSFIDEKGVTVDANMDTRIKLKLL